MATVIFVLWCLKSEVAEQGRPKPLPEDHRRLRKMSGICTSKCAYHVTRQTGASSKEVRQNSQRFSANASYPEDVAAPCRDHAITP